MSEDLPTNLIKLAAVGNCVYVEWDIVSNYCHAHVVVCTYAVHCVIDDNTITQGLWLHAVGLSMFTIEQK